jgi:hypothetical protein
MKVFKRQTGPIIAALLASGAALYPLGDHGSLRTEQALAASPQEKAQAPNELDQVIASLGRVDAAYASGNGSEAKTKFEEATSSWNKVSPALSACEAREVQLLFDSLDTKLKSGAPAVEVNSTVYGMLEELVCRL